MNENIRYIYSVNYPLVTSHFDYPLVPSVLGAIFFVCELL